MIDSFCFIIGSFFQFVIGSLKSEIAPFSFLFFFFSPHFYKRDRIIGQLLVLVGTR
jgi:hypothetical protein